MLFMAIGFKIAHIALLKIQCVTSLLRIVLIRSQCSEGCYLYERHQIRYKNFKVRGIAIARYNL